MKGRAFVDIKIKEGTGNAKKNTPKEVEIKWKKTWEYQRKHQAHSFPASLKVLNRVY